MIIIGINKSKCKQKSLISDCFLSNYPLKSITIPKYMSYKSWTVESALQSDGYSHIDIKPIGLIVNLPSSNTIFLYSKIISLFIQSKSSAIVRVIQNL